MKHLKKLKQKRGFSLLESMLALMIISILTIGIVTGVSTAWSIYKKSLFVSEGDMLSATLDMALSDVLRYSSKPEVDADSGALLKFTNGAVGVVNGHFFLKEGLLYMNQTDKIDDIAEDAPVVPLVNASSYTSMELDSFTISYEASGLYRGKYVIVSKENDNLKKELDFCFRISNMV